MKSFSLLLLLMGTAHATPSPDIKCELNFEGSPVKAVHFPYEAVANTCEFSQDFINTLKVTGSWPSIKPKVDLLAKSSGDGASFDGGSIITTPFSVVFRTSGGGASYNRPGPRRGGGSDHGHGGNSDEYFLPRHLTDHILNHEFGHAIFEQAVGEQVPEYAFVRSQRMMASKVQIELLAAGIKHPESDPRYKRYSDSIMGNPEQLRLWTMVSSYSEFIADVVAVFEANQKDAIFKSLQRPGASQATEDELQYRNFAASHAVEGWKGGEVHIQLAPTRSYVGAKLWPKTQRQKTRYLDILIQASIEEIKQRIAANEIALAASETNRRLIERLEKVKR